MGTVEDDNLAILARMRDRKMGVPMRKGTPETDADPSNPANWTLPMSDDIQERLAAALAELLPHARIAIEMWEHDRGTCRGEFAEEYAACRAADVALEEYRALTATAGLAVDRTGVLSMLVRTAMALSSDPSAITAAVMKGSGGTANPASVAQLIQRLRKNP